MRPLTVAVLHHPLSFAPLELAQRLRDEVGIVWVVGDALGDTSADRRLLPRLGQVVDIGDGGPEQAAARLGEAGVSGLVAFIDEVLVFGADVADLLGLPFLTPGSARMVSDKRRQREAFDAAGLPGPRWRAHRPGASPAAVDTMADALRYPAVVKPVTANGSRGIWRARSAEELAGWFNGPGVDQDAIVEEELADGPADDPRFASYLSVESVIAAGPPTHVVVTGRLPLADPFRETGSVMPAAIGADLRHEVESLATAAIAALGLTHAVVHTEIKLTPDGPRLIEVNGRLGGRPPFLLAAISPVNLWLVNCQLVCGRTAGMCLDQPVEGVAFWKMFQPPVTATRLVAIHGVDRLATIDGVAEVRMLRRPGDRVDWREGTLGAVASVHGVVPDHDAVVATLSAIARTIRLEYA